MTSSTMPAKVVAKDRGGTDIWSFVFEVEESAFAPAGAGAHIDVKLPSGLIRQYSLVREPRDGVYEIGVLREEHGRGGSKELCDLVAVGDALEISGPRNNFPLEPGRARYLLIGGGIGLTPLLAMARSLHERGSPFDFHICAKTPETLPFRAEIERSAWAERVFVHYSVGSAAERLDLPALLGATAPDTQVYICGPKRMLATADEITRSWMPSRLRTERFTPADVIISAEDQGSFEVVAARSGKRFCVAHDVSLLAALKLNGIAIDSSCHEGTCGTCVTPVLSGELVHRDSCLYDDERESGKLMAVCVSRARPGTELVLDV